MEDDGMKNGWTTNDLMSSAMVSATTIRIGSSRQPDVRRFFLVVSSGPAGLVAEASFPGSPGCPGSPGRPDPPDPPGPTWASSGQTWYSRVRGPAEKVLALGDASDPAADLKSSSAPPASAL